MNTAKQKALAYEIADALDDMKSIEWHLTLVEKYKDEFLKEKFEYVMSLPDRKILTSRAAYYNHLVTKHGKRYLRD